MIPFQFNVDIIDELEKAFPSYKLVTPRFVIDELVGLKKNLKGKNRVAAELALKIAKSSNIKIENIPLKNEESVDGGLLRISKVLATNDINLRKRAKEKGVTILFLRQKKYIDVDGYLE